MGQKWLIQFGTFGTETAPVYRIVFPWTYFVFTVTVFADSDPATGGAIAAGGIFFGGFSHTGFWEENRLIRMMERRASTAKITILYASTRIT